jgi:hypothetical protein
METLGQLTGEEDENGRNAGKDKWNPRVRSKHAVAGSAAKCPFHLIKNALRCKSAEIRMLLGNSHRASDIIQPR